MTNNPHNLKVGQKLWFVYSDERRDGSEMEIVKIGNKWATLNCGYRRHPFRIDLSTLRADGGEYSSPGTCYLDRRTYELRQEFFKTWQDFYRRLCHFPPDGATTESIRETAARWGIELEGSD